MRGALLVTLIALWSPDVQAQDASALTRRLSISGAIGSGFGGPAAAVGSDMEARGFADPSPGGCVIVFCSEPRSDYPSIGPSFGATVNVRYQVTARWAVSVGRTWTETDANGHRRGDYVDMGGWGVMYDGDYVYTHWETSSTWVAAELNPRAWVGFGAGLGLHRVRGGDAGLYPQQEVSATRLGATASASLRLPARTRVFWEGSARGHWVPGSWNVAHSANGGAVPFEARWSYASIEMGIGVRL